MMLNFGLAASEMRLGVRNLVVEGKRFDSYM